MQLIINKRYKLEEGNTLIIGRDVKDKTELAVDLAKQAIDQGVDVHYLGFPLAISPAKYYDNPEAIIAELNNITGIMYHRLKQINEEEKGNYLISPYSINVALSMLRDGSKGDTYQQIN